jgi:hypothetical protein
VRQVKVVVSAQTVDPHGFGSNFCSELGTVAHICKPSDLRGRDQEDPSSRPAWGWGGQFARPHLNQ